MPYGNGQRLGESINPAFMQADYSGYERAGNTVGNAFANFGEQVGGVIKKYGDDEKTIKKAEQMAKSIRDAIPELAQMGNNALNELNNPDLSQRDRLAIAEGIQDSLKLGILGLDRKDAALDRNFRERQAANLMAMQQSEIEAAQNMPIKKNIVDVSVPGGKQQLLKDDYGNLYNLDGTQFNPSEITPPDGVTPQGTPIDSSAQGRIALPMRQKGDDLVAAEIAALSAATPQVGDMPNYGSIQEAMNLDEQGNGMVLPPRQQPITQGGIDTPRIGFTATEVKESDKPQEVKLPDGTTGYGTFKNNVFKPAIGPDGKPLVIPKEIDPKIEMDMAKTESEKMEKAQAGLDKSNQFLNSLEKLEKHKGFKNLFGTNIGIPTFVAGSAGADAKAELDKVTAKAFMESIQSLKGMGALSNAEGEKASAAFIALNPNMSEEAARQSIKEAKDIIRAGITRAQKMMEGNPSMGTPTTRQSNTDRLRSILPVVPPTQ